MKKLIGIFIVILLIGTTILPLVSSTEKDDTNLISNLDYNDDCGCNLKGLKYRLNDKKDIPKDPNYIAPLQNINGVPDYFSWKDFGEQDWTTPVKDQGDCGSCYIFAALGIIESVINIKEGNAGIDADLSEQYVLSCLPNSSYRPGKGCQGGEESWVLQLILATTPEGNYNNGALLEDCFPYQGNENLPCEDKCSDWEDKLIPITDTLQWYPTGSLEDIQLIKSQIMEKGSLTTCMQSTIEFINWMYSHHDPSDYYPYVEGANINHVINIVGWKDDPTIGQGGYWICKNSWGADYGYDGFFNIEYGSLKIDSSLINWVDYDPTSIEWTNEPNPPSETSITGEINGDVKTEYEYTFNSVDPEGNDLKYYISWGDGNWEWTEYYPSGEDVTVFHTFNKKGEYSVASLAMNTNDTIGPWGTLSVSMPKSKQYINTSILNFLDQNPHLFPLLRQLLRL